ncbi:MAG: hypothetical protein MRY74_09335 [Neomegalonema sp.]|nr:hypothetical protein [Neomegalonema sp.]
MDWFFSNVVFYIVIGLFVGLKLLNIISFFRWNPWFYWIGGLVVIGASAASVINIIDENNARRTALASAPPKAIAIDAFEAAKHIRPAGEVALIAPLATRKQIQFESEIAFKVKHDVWAAPLTLASDPNTASVVVIVAGKDLKEAPFRAWRQRRRLGSDAAPIRGAVDKYPADKLLSALDAAMAASGVALAKDPILIKPFLRGRDQELAPSSVLLNAGAPALFGFAVFLYGFARRWMKRRAARREPILG